MGLFVFGSFLFPLSVCVLLFPNLIVCFWECLFFRGLSKWWLSFGLQKTLGMDCATSSCVFSVRQQYDNQ